MINRVYRLASKRRQCIIYKIRAKKRSGLFFIMRYSVCEG